jgi:hypothetical protein
MPGFSLARQNRARANARSGVAIVLAMASSFLGAACGRGSGEDFSRLSLPIPVDIEGQPIHCPLYLNLEMKSDNVPFDKFAAGPLDSAQAMFVTAVQAIRKEDTAAFASVWTSPDQMKRLDQATTVTMVDDNAENWIKAARSAFDFDKLNVVAEVRVGPETMFVWESATKSGARREAFYVGFDKKNQSRLSVVSSNAPVMALIQQAFDAAARSGGDAYKPLPNVDLAYHFPIPLAGTGGAGAHPVVFEFDGAPMDFPPADESVKPPTPLLEFLRNATLALRDGKTDVFSNDFAPRSQKTISEWFARIQARQQTAQQAQTATPLASSLEIRGLLSGMKANVKFVLNADPVFLVFQSSRPGDGWTPPNLSYSYVLREGETYKIANFSASDDLDAFLQSPALFDKNILKSAPR